MKVAADAGATPLTTAVSKPVTVDVDRLLGLAPPARTLDKRTSPVETTVYRLNDVIVQSIQHAVDGDYHFVLVNSEKRTLIAESADPDCAHSSVLLDRIRDVRGSAPTASAGDRVSVEGVGFFDYEPNGAIGEARNGIELHPITAICFGTGCTPK